VFNFDRIFIETSRELYANCSKWRVRRHATLWSDFLVPVGGTISSPWAAERSMVPQVLKLNAINVILYVIRCRTVDQWSVSLSNRLPVQETILLCPHNTGNFGFSNHESVHLIQLPAT